MSRRLQPSVHPRTKARTAERRPGGVVWHPQLCWPTDRGFWSVPERTGAALKKKKKVLFSPGGAFKAFTPDRGLRLQSQNEGQEQVTSAVFFFFSDLFRKMGTTFKCQRSICFDVFGAEITRMNCVLMELLLFLLYPDTRTHTPT